MKKLLEEYERYQEVDLTDDQVFKIKGQFTPGCELKIHWNDPFVEGDSKFFDMAYGFLLPMCDKDSIDWFVHCPHPTNPGGKDSVEPEWHHIYELLTNPMVELIEINPTKVKEKTMKNKITITEKQAQSFNRMLLALNKISKGYQTPQQLRKGSKGDFGLDFEEAIEMAYENIQNDAKSASKGVKHLSF